MIYFTADTHFGHYNVIRFCDRPFASAEEMDEAMIQNWNDRVTGNDTVYILGDMFFRSTNAEGILKRLKGKKRLIVGNHDGSWMTKFDYARYFFSVDRFLETSDGKLSLTLCHYPMLSWKHAKRSYMIHGHIHNDTREENFTEQIHDKYIKNALFTKKVAWTASYKEVIDVIRDDLIIMIRCLEIYMERFINRSISDNIVNVRSEDIEEYNINKVLSFNYTKTFELLYGIGKKIEYDYIHGKADISNTIETNNMVLGINEFLPEDRKNIDLKFIEFKKYYQRIYKETGCNYRRWLDEIEELNEQFDNQLIKKREHPVHNVYIYGHSLDVTDGDVLRSLILTRNVYTTIFYHNKEAMGKEIANLVRIIGQDELIKRTGGLDKTITFRKQRELRVI